MRDLRGQELQDAFSVIVGNPEIAGGVEGDTIGNYKWVETTIPRIAKNYLGLRGLAAFDQSYLSASDFQDRRRPGVCSADSGPQIVVPIEGD